MPCGNQQNADQRKRKIKLQAAFRRGVVEVIAERENRMAAIKEHAAERIDEQRHERDGGRMGQKHQKIDQPEAEYSAENQSQKCEKGYPADRVHNYIKRRCKDRKQHKQCDCIGQKAASVVKKQHFAAVRFEIFTHTENDPPDGNHRKNALRKLRDECAQLLRGAGFALQNTQRQGQHIYRRYRDGCEDAHAFEQIFLPLKQQLHIPLSAHMYPSSTFGLTGTKSCGAPLTRRR